MAKDKAKAEIKPAEEADAKPKKPKLIILALVLLLLVGGGGGAAWYFLVGSKKGGDEHKKVEKEKPPVFTSLEVFTVNLQSSDGSDHFLQLNVDLKVADPLVVEAIKSHMPEVRNGVLLLLSSKTVEDVATLEGKKKLSAEILQRVNEPLHLKEGEKDKGAQDVLFTAFVIQ